MADPFLRKRQREFDELVHGRGYVELDDNLDRALHISLHIGITALKLKRFKDQGEKEELKDRVVRNFIPDLAISRTSLANTLKIDLAGAIEKNPKHAAPAKDLADGLMKLVVVQGELDVYLESAHRGVPATMENKNSMRNIVIPELHATAQGLATYYGFPDLTALHEDRLAFLGTQPTFAV